MAKDGIEQAYIGLDIGSSKVCCIVGLQEAESELPSIIGVGVAPTTGLRRGAVVDVDEAVSSVTAAIDEAERISGLPIHRATVSIDGASVKSFNSSGVIAVGHGDHQITAEDVHRAEEAATMVQLPANHEVVQVFPRQYRVDGEPVAKDPVGMSGVRLEVDSHIVTVHSAALKNLHRVLDQAGIDIQGQVLVPLAAAETVLTKHERELGVALVDIGAGTTGVAVFQEGSVVHSGILPVGSGHITNDLAIGLRTNVDTAEEVKVKYGEAVLNLAAANETVRIPELGTADQDVEKRHLDVIITARLAELMDMIADEIAKAGKEIMLPAGVVLTGGGANMKNIQDYAKHSLRLPVAIGVPKEFTGMIDRIAEPGFAAPLGLMLENRNYSQHSGGHSVSKLSGGGAFGKLKNTFKKFLP